MITVVIDPGHYGGYNLGVCPDYSEGNTMLLLAGYLGEALESLGAQVIYTRTGNEQNPSLAERGQMAANRDLFISLHSDAAENPSVKGVTVYYSVQRPASQPLGADIGRAVADVMGNQFRGTIARPSTNNPQLDFYGVIRSAAAAGAQNAYIIEHGFHTNPEDCAFLSKPENLRAIAAAEAGVIANYYGLTTRGPVCINFRYTVRPGDSLYSISKRYEVPWQSIAEANNLSNPYLLQAGQIIFIPLCG